MTKDDLKKWTQPSDGQQKAGNYFKPRLFIAGMEIAIENPAGTTRTGVDEDGTRWMTPMNFHYGYVVGSKGADGDEVDVYIGTKPNSDRVFVVHQSTYGDWDTFDEDKCMLFFADQASAEQAYLDHYDDARFLGSVTAMSLDKFKSKILAGTGEMIKSHLIDLSGLSCDCENDTMEFLGKAISEDQHDIWAIHENPFLSKLIELFTDRGLARIDAVKTNLDLWLNNAHLTGLKPLEPLPGMAPMWTKSELSLVKLYLESLPSGQWALADYDYLVQYLFQRYLPAAELMTDAEWLVTRAHLMGKAQSVVQTIAPHAIDALLIALPVTVVQAGVQFTMASAEQQIMTYARLTAMDRVVAMSDAAKHSLKSTLLDHMHKQFSGDDTATPGKLQQSLFDKFSVMNRDWRRIALTEAGDACNNGMIASLVSGAKVKRLEQYRGACPYCKKIDGGEFTVVAADDPDKNGDTDVWVGKDNMGRSSSPRKQTDDGLVMRLSSELWWVTTGTIHPHCRGTWSVLSAPSGNDNPEFTEWFKQYVR